MRQPFALHGTFFKSTETHRDLLAQLEDLMKEAAALTDPGPVP